MTSSFAPLSSSTDLEARFIETAFQNSHNARLFERLVTSDLPNWILVSGSLFQTVWNVQTGRRATHGIKDYDVFYFDDHDVSWEAEDRWIKHIARDTTGLGIDVEVRNQARVHLWYEEKFGAAYPPLQSAFQGIDRFLHASCAVGLYPSTDGAIQVYAPYGLDDIFEMVLRANPLNPLDDRRAEKEAKWRALWPELKVV